MKSKYAIHLPCCSFFLFFERMLLPIIAGPARNIVLIFTIPSTWPQISSVYGYLLIILLVLTPDWSETRKRRFSKDMRVLLKSYFY